MRLARCKKPCRYAIHFHFGDRLEVGGLHEEKSLALGKGRSEIATISKILTIDAPAGRVRGIDDLKGFACMRKINASMLRYIHSFSPFQ